MNLRNIYPMLDHYSMKKSPITLISDFYSKNYLRNKGFEYNNGFDWVEKNPQESHDIR